MSGRLTASELLWGTGGGLVGSGSSEAAGCGAGAVSLPQAVSTMPVAAAAIKARRETQFKGFGAK